MEKSHKKAVLCFLLCLMFGIFGMHRFYSGRYLSGFFQLITGGFFGIWTLWDLLVILFDKFEDGDGRPIRW